MFSFLIPQVDLRRVKRKFFVTYEQSLYEWLDGEVHGDFKKMLMAVCGIENPEDDDE